jgi:hypothetical protein
MVSVLGPEVVVVPGRPGRVKPSAPQKIAAGLCSAEDRPVGSSPPSVETTVLHAVVGSVPVRSGSPGMVGSVVGNDGKDVMLLGIEMRAFGLRSPADDDDPVSGSRASVGNGSDGTEIDPDEPEPPEPDDEPLDPDELPDPEDPEESDPEESCDAEDDPPVMPLTRPPTGSLGCELPPLPSSAKATPV